MDVHDIGLPFHSIGNRPAKKVEEALPEVFRRTSLLNDHCNCLIDCAIDVPGSLRWYQDNKP